jgi:hypothetical protein
MRARIHGVALCMALVGCRDPPPETGTSATSTEESIIDAAGSDAPIVRVLDVGREPRRMLEQPPRSGERDVELVMEMSALGDPSRAPSTMHVSVRWSTSAATDVPRRFAVQGAELKMGGAPASGAEVTVVDGLATMYAQIGAHRRAGDHGCRR